METELETFVNNACRAFLDDLGQIEADKQKRLKQIRRRSIVGYVIAGALIGLGAVATANANK